MTKAGLFLFQKMTHLTQYREKYLLFYPQIILYFLFPLNWLKCLKSPWICIGVAQELWFLNNVSCKIVNKLFILCAYKLSHFWWRFEFLFFGSLAINHGVFTVHMLPWSGKVAFLKYLLENITVCPDFCLLEKRLSLSDTFYTFW